MPVTQVNRRDIFSLLGAAAAGWPLPLCAQPQSAPMVGVLSLSSRNGPLMRGVHEGLAESGYVPGQNVAVEYRWANNNFKLLPGLAADLIERKPAVIVAVGSPYAALAAKAATSTIPILFIVAQDPIEYGLVTSLNRPGSNITGFHIPAEELGGKLIELLVQVAPRAAKVGFLSIPLRNPIAQSDAKQLALAAGALKREFIVAEVRGNQFEAAFASLVQQGAAALIVGNYGFFRDTPSRETIVKLAAEQKLPAIYNHRLFPQNGGLMSYQPGGGVIVIRELASGYVSRILKGDKAAELPVQRPTKYELVINLATAKALGLTIPRTLLVAASELID